MHGRKCCIFGEVRALRRERMRFSLRNTQESTENPGLPVQVVPRDSQRLPFPYHLRRLDPLNHRPSRPLGPRALHRTQPSFHMAVV